MDPQRKKPEPSRDVEWLMIFGPILLLLPLAAPIFTGSDIGLFVLLAPICLTATFMLPFFLLLIPILVLFSGAIVYEAVRDWLERGRTGGSLGIAILWAGPALFYGSLCIWGAIAILHAFIS